jgi:diguanylate cyclase (GGDEF)-like protein
MQRRHGPGTPPAAATEALDQAWLLHLAHRLQATLQLEGLIEAFATECAPVVPFDGVSFVNGQRDLAIDHGSRGRHSCSYTLLISEQTLGEITYSRDCLFTEADAARLELLTSQLVYPLRNALLYRDAVLAASRDPLTGANNRATLETTLAREVSLALRHGTPLSVIMLDLDHFKQVNDRHGHATGDCVLRALATQLSQSIRGSDELFRYGGEEFVIVLRSTDLRGAALLAERVRKAVEALRVECEGKTLSLTVSAGAATLGAQDHALSLLRRADKALYRSKADGRNRVTAAT